MSNDLLVVIPARGGSKGIPGKNIRFLHSKPLIWYSLEVAQSIQNATIIVSTDDDKIENYCKAHTPEMYIIKRPAYLAEDHIPLDPVIKHAVETAEDNYHKKFSTIVTIQPTSPLLKPNTLIRALQYFQDKNIDTLIAATKRTHLFWLNDKSNHLVPFYSERLNRQLLAPVYDEAGSFVICKRENLFLHDSRISGTTECFPISADEGLDIDTWKDWIIAESILKRKKILFRVIGSSNLGLGHVYRTLTLADLLTDHEIMFTIQSDHDIGFNKLLQSNHQTLQFKTEAEFEDIVDSIQPHVIINDMLDTSSNYVRKLKEKQIAVINFEDLGSGASVADLTINALYECSFSEDNHLYGYKYECLRNEFYLYPEKKIPPAGIKEILISFGGTDPNGLTTRLLEVIAANFRLFCNKNIKIVVIAGLGYEDKEKLGKCITSLQSKSALDIELLLDVNLMAKYMYKADLIITSNGRTVYEAISLQTPVITISQNIREVSHLFSKICKGIINLGIHFEVTNTEIFNSIRLLIEDASYREYIFQEISKYSSDIKRGKYRLLSAIKEKAMTTWEGKETNLCSRQ